MKNKMLAAFLSVVAGVAMLLGVQSPALAADTPSYCVVAIYLPGGWGCFIRDGDNWIASDTEGDGRHVEVVWQVRNSSGRAYAAGRCAAGYGATVVCYSDFNRGDDVHFAVLVYDGSTLKDESGWSSWISVGA